MLTKITKYSLYSGLLIFILGLFLSTIFDQKSSGTALGGIGMTIVFLITIPSSIIYLVKRSLKKDKQSHNQTPANNEPPSIKLATNSRALHPNTWFFHNVIVSNSNDKSELTESDFTSFVLGWAEKQKHLFFDKKINIDFSLSDNVTDRWEQLYQGFDELKSKRMVFVTGSTSHNTEERKKGGGATSSMSSEDFSLRKKLPKSILSHLSPLAFCSSNRGVYIFPSFVLFDLDGRRELIHINAVTFRDYTQSMVGRAPSDANVTGKTWKYVNVSGLNKGEKDKRHKGNVKLDEYDVDVIELSSDEFGIKTKLQFSKATCTLEFARFFKALQLSQAIAGYIAATVEE